MKSVDKKVPNLVKNILFSLLGALITCIIIIIYFIYNARSYPLGLSYKSGDIGKLIATGPQDTGSYYYYEVIYNSDIINDESKKELKVKGIKQEDKIKIGLYESSDGDVVYMYDCSRDAKGKKTCLFTFDCNLPYSLRDVVSEFEKVIGEKLTIDDISDNNPIQVDFVYSSEEGKYIIYYKYFYNNKVYVVNK